ncbi:ESX secretion-associated protein EspG [Amycolatopsis sp. NPDC059027]|uniref:ESX secretion-associated protein EspG n=1 Tax=Amycolatopsis sp. NPDC059027 TaxID=3346709 RepID=UPI00366B08AC
MEAINRPVVLPKVAFMAAWEMVDLGSPHPVIGTNLRYVTTDDFDRQLHARTMELLNEHGLARHNRLNGLWRSTLQVVGNADREYYGWSSFQDGTGCAALVAVRGEDAVRVVVNDDVVVVDPIEVKWPATTLLDTLPAVPGAAIRTVSVLKTFYDNPNITPANPLAEPVDTSNADYIKALLVVPRDAVHQLYTARRGSDGARHRSLPITALDLTGRGRVLTYETGGGDIVLHPGTSRDFIRTFNITHDGL